MKRVLLMGLFALTTMFAVSCTDEKDEVADLQDQIDKLTPKVDANTAAQTSLTASIAKLDGADSANAALVADLKAEVQGHIETIQTVFNESSESIITLVGELSEKIAGIEGVSAEYDDETGILTITLGNGEVVMTGDLRGTDSDDAIAFAAMTVKLEASVATAQASFTLAKTAFDALEDGEQVATASTTLVRINKAVSAQTTVVVKYQKIFDEAEAEHDRIADATTSQSAIDDAFELEENARKILEAGEATLVELTKKQVKAQAAYTLAMSGADVVAAQTALTAAKAALKSAKDALKAHLA